MKSVYFFPKKCNVFLYLLDVVGETTDIFKEKHFIVRFIVL